MRAKETFLTPNAPYALPIPSDLLASFDSSLDLEPHGRRPSNFSIQGPDPLLTVPGQPPLPPYPEIFEELEERVTAMLSDSLDRFVVATFHNVGMPRAYCGCAGGTVIGLTGRFVCIFFAARCVNTHYVALLLPRRRGFYAPFFSRPYLPNMAKCVPSLASPCFSSPASGPLGPALWPGPGPASGRRRPEAGSGFLWQQLNLPKLYLGPSPQRLAWFIDLL